VPGAANPGFPNDSEGLPGFSFVWAAACPRLSTINADDKRAEDRNIKRMGNSLECSDSQCEHVGDEIALLLLVKPEREHQVEVFDGIVERQQAPVMQVGG
jgi:hypothetical protein